MKICKKFASVFLAVFIMLSVMPIAGIDFFRAGAFDSFGQITNTVSYTFDAYTGTMTISGFTAGATTDSLAEMTAEGWTASVATADGSDRIGTGSVITLTSAEGEIIECTAVVYGDTNGDAWYDGTDSTLVSCLANGLLSKEQVGEAAYTAADCNHDGVIDENDVALLEQAGLILANVDQSKTPDELHEDAAFSEYLNLISQTVKAEEIVPDTAPETAETEITPTFIQRIINLIRTILSIVVLLFK